MGGTPFTRTDSNNAWACFTALGAKETRVDFEHRHLERLGENAPAIRDQLNSGWGGILDLYSNVASE